MDFEEFWAIGIKLLKTGISASSDGNNYFINTWRADKEEVSQRFPVVDASPRGIGCLSIHASKNITIPKNDMKLLYDIWDSYVDGKISRMDIIEKIPRPTYCVSLMKHLKDKI